MEGNPNHWPDWITAVSTGLTAALAVLGTILGLRASCRAKMPIVEPSGYIQDDGIICFILIVRNRLHETITLDSIRIMSPKNLAFAIEDRETQPWLEGRTYSSGTEILKKKNYPIEPLGTPRGDITQGDTARIYSYLYSSKEWPGGVVKLELRISSKASTIRDRRIVVKTHIPTATKTQTEEKANSQD